MSLDLKILERLFSAGTIKGNDLAAAISLHNNGPMTPRRLAEALGVSTRTVQRSLGRLARAGLVRKRSRNAGQALADEWELTAASKMALDRSGSSNTDPINHSDNADTTLSTERERLVVRVADSLGLPQSLVFIREVVLSVPEMSPQAILAVAKRVRSYLWRPDGTPNPFVRQPAAYFAKSLKREWEEVQRYFQARAESESQEEIREIQASPSRRNREEALAISNAGRVHSEDEDIGLTVRSTLVPDEPTEIVVTPGGRLILVPRREAHRFKPPLEGTEGKRMPGMFASLARMLKNRIDTGMGATPTCVISVAAGI